MKAGVTLVIATLALTAPAAAGAKSYATAEGCAEHESFVTGDEAAVAARLPDGYTPVRQDGRPLIFVRGIRCDALTVEGRTESTTMGTFGVVVETLDGTGCASAIPGAGDAKGDFPPACNLYTLAWVADRQAVARWLTERMPGFPAQHADGLSFELGDDGAFRFRAPGFGIEAANRPERPREIAIRRSYWAKTSTGTMRFRFSSDTIAAGDAEGAVTAEPGSELAALLGAERAEYARPYNSFAAERFARGIYRPQRLDEAPGTDTFAGSCELKGVVTFDPPVRNEAQQGRYAYAATGSCTGRLNGRALDAAPATLRHEGPAMASCTRPFTTAPGEGTLTVAGDTAVRYTLDFSGTGTEFDAEIYGDRSGLAKGHGTFATDRTPPDAPAQCGGEGARSLPMDFTFETSHPLVSERPTQGRGGEPARGGDEAAPRPAGKPGPKRKAGPRRKCRRARTSSWARHSPRGRWRAAQRKLRPCAARRPARRRRGTR